MMTFYNMRNPAVKRLMKEAEELRHPTDEYHAQPLEDNLFEWHFTLRGPPNTDFEGGIYHGRITLPSDYPMKPPSIILLTPNGRFETNKKICLSISGHHPESWQPSWSIRTALLAIIGFMPTHGNGALGSLDYTPEERRQLAAKSQEFKCPECGLIKDIFLKKEYFGSPQKFQSSNILPDLPDELEKNENIITDKLTTELSSDDYSEKSAAEEMNEIKDGTSLVHRHKNLESSIVKEETKQLTKESGSNRLYSALIFVIVAIMSFLCLRRIFSM